MKRILVAGIGNIFFGDDSRNNSLVTTRTSALHLSWQHDQFFAWNPFVSGLVDVEVGHHQLWRRVRAQTDIEPSCE